MSPLRRVRLALIRWLARPLLPLVKDILEQLPEAKRPRMVPGWRDSDGTLRSGTRVSDTVYLYCPENVRIGENVFIWHHTILDGTAGIEIGEGCQIGAWVGIFSHSSHVAIRLYGRHYSEVPEADKRAYDRGAVRIGKYVFVGSGSMIFSGVTIGDGAVIGAGALVSKDVAPFAIVSGSPARVVGDARMLDRFHLADPKLDPRVADWYREWQED